MSQSLRLLLLGEVEDPAVGLSQVLLLFEVDFEGSLDGHEGDSSQDGPLQVGVDAAEHEFAYDGCDGRENECSTQDPRGRDVIGQRTGFGWDPRHRATDTWEYTVEDLQFVGVLPPQSQHVVLPADHLPQDEHDGDGGQPDEEEQRVSSLHHIQALLMAHHLHDCDGSVRDSGPVNRPHHDPSCSERTGLGDEAVGQVQHVHHRAECGEDNEVLCVALWAGDPGCAVAPLFLVHPALQTGLVHPFSGTPTAARANPLCCPVVLICGEANPAAPVQILLHNNRTLVRHFRGDFLPSIVSSGSSLFLSIKK